MWLFLTLIVALPPLHTFVSQCILLYGISAKLNDIERYDIASGIVNLPPNIFMDEDILSCGGCIYVKNKVNSSSGKRSGKPIKKTISNSFKTK